MVTEESPAQAPDAPLQQQGVEQASPAVTAQVQSTTDVKTTLINVANAPAKANLAGG